MVVFEERGNRSTRRKPLGAEKRTNKLKPHMTPDLGIEPAPHWWEASALTTAPSLHPRYFTLRKIMNWIRFYCRFQRPVCNKGLHGQEGKAIKSLFYTGPQTTEESSEHLSVYQESYFLLTTRMFSWIPSKFFNSRKQTLNSVAVTSSAQMLAASWTFFRGLVWITVRKTSEGGVLN